MIELRRKYNHPTQDGRVVVKVLFDYTRHSFNIEQLKERNHPPSPYNNKVFIYDLIQGVEFTKQNYRI